MAHQKNIFANLTKNGYDFDSFAPNGYCFTGYCHFLFDNLREKRSMPQLTSQVLQVLKILGAHRCVGAHRWKIATLEHKD